MEVTLYYYKNLVVEWFEKLEKLNGEKGVTHDQLIKLFAHSGKENDFWCYVFVYYHDNELE